MTLQNIHSATIIPSDNDAVNPTSHQIIIVLRPYVGTMIVHDVTVIEDYSHTSYEYTTQIRGDRFIDDVREFIDNNLRDYDFYVGQLIEATFV